MTSIPIFYTYEKGVFTFNPKDPALIYCNPYKVTVKITDGIDNPEYTFSVTVLPLQSII
jgi:hypothetical protein